MEMLLPCKLVAELAFKAGGDVFHEIVSIKPEQVIHASPAKYQSCQIHHGDVGTNGCIIRWKYTIDGKEHTATTALENVDMEKRTITYKWIEGDMLDLYKHLAVTIHVETKRDIDFVTWTLAYDLKEPDTPHPLSLVKFYIELTNDIEAHLLR